MLGICVVKVGMAELNGWGRRGGGELWCVGELVGGRYLVVSVGFWGD